jgi:hypothetical protein
MIVFNEIEINYRSLEFLTEVLDRLYSNNHVNGDNYMKQELSDFLVHLKDFQIKQQNIVSVIYD